MTSPLRLVLALLSALAVTSVVLIDLDQSGPGPIMPAHAQVAQLAGVSGCVLCHGSGPDDLARACLECHPLIQDQIDRQLGLHGNLDEGAQRECGACHAEHSGADSARLVQFSFDQAGLQGPDGFDHGTVPFHLAGRHDSLECADCHLHAGSEELPEGSARFLALAQDCTSCHEDPHEGAMQRGCEECHGQEHAFDDLASFPHDARVPLHGSHSGLQCSDCHQEDSEYSVTALSDPQWPAPWRACAACHDSPHDASFLAALPNPATAAGEDGCVLCHSALHPEFHGEQLNWQDSWHGASGFALERPHDGLACSACHDTRQGADDFALRYPGRAADSCQECHQDPHQAQFDRPPHQQRACLSCHARDTFLPHGFDLARHNRDSFALSGSHAEIECASCHSLADAQDPTTRRFYPLAHLCEDCHSDAHDQAFLAREMDSESNPAGSCARCHTAATFRDLTQPFDHGAWTGFALQLGHQIEDCEACHARSQSADENGRTLGWVQQLHPGDPALCSGCHADIHGDSFDLPGLATQIEGRRGCERCHTLRSFAPLQEGAFDHGAWTGFALRGAHQQARCESCHGLGDKPARLGRVQDQYPGDAASCATCHASPHGRDFDRPGMPEQIDGQRGCARCHDTQTFRMASGRVFDHRAWTGFELRGAHADAACTSCHAPLPKVLQDGRSHARAAGSACTDCHLDPHLGQFLEQGQQDCLRCHERQVRSFALPRFDHAELTRFPLDATHAPLDCAACHLKARTEDGGEAVRYKPLGTACQDCHQVVPDGGGG